MSASDFVKEISETLSTRVKSRIFGSVFVVFAIWNWQIFYYFFFAEVPVKEKLNYFNNEVDFKNYVIPLSIGFLLAYFTPWIQFFGEKMAELPESKRREIKENTRLAFKKGKVENERLLLEWKNLQEKSIVEEAVIDSEVAKIENSEIREHVEEKIASSREKTSSNSTRNFEDMITAAIGDVASIEEALENLSQFELKVGKARKNYRRLSSAHRIHTGRIKNEIEELQKKHEALKTKKSAVLLEKANNTLDRHYKSFSSERKNDKENFQLLRQIRIKTNELEELKKATEKPKKKQ